LRDFVICVRMISRSPMRRLANCAVPPRLPAARRVVLVTLFRVKVAVRTLDRMRKRKS
jgi:hypothetical protein